MSLCLQTKPKQMFFSTLNSTLYILIHIYYIILQHYYIPTIYIVHDMTDFAGVIFHIQQINFFNIGILKLPESLHLSTLRRQRGVSINLFITVYMFDGTLGTYQQVKGIPIWFPLDNFWLTQSSYSPTAMILALAPVTDSHRLCDNFEVTGNCVLSSQFLWLTPEIFDC